MYRGDLLEDCEITEEPVNSILVEVVTTAANVPMCGGVV